MRKLVTIKEAVVESGLSEYTIRLGIKEERFPHTRTGGDKGKFLLDLELIENRLRQEAEDSVKHKRESEDFYIDKIRRVAN